ncbi:FecR domain-containing protein [Thiohalorhabdus methylotrophus]|uniref:FecR domain-containing protein n=1 Tax=Thiohalorhabdus methylotrophus TaxID=3242694 RepID=A0ABV4TXT1_9GAMM
MRLVLLLSLLVLHCPGTVLAEDTGRVATIVGIQGTVEVLPAQGFRREPARKGMHLEPGDAVLTGGQGSAVVRFPDDSRVALDGSTRLTLNGPDQWHQEGGKAYYRVESRSHEGRTVRTDYSVIGVKGTEFLVGDESETRAVALQEGDVEIRAPEGRFELYQSKRRSEFESFMKERREEFARYREKVRREFQEYTRSFRLRTGGMATFEGNQATKAPISEALAEDIQRLRGML